VERDAAEVLKDALALSPEVRAALIDSLLAVWIKRSTLPRKKPGVRKSIGVFSRSTAEPFISSPGRKRAAVSGLGWRAEAATSASDAHSVPGCQVFSVA
jgi:hypothetical protein